MLRYLSLDINYLYLEAHISLLGTDNVRGQISEHNFALNGDYCLYIPQFSKRRALRKRFEDSKLSFPRATLSENCSLLGTGNVRGQIS